MTLDDICNSQEPYDWLAEKRATFLLYERCYDFEQQQTLDELRNMASSHHDRAIIEMLRLGGCDGNPRGLYPIEFVAQIWDVVAQSIGSAPAVSQEEEQYFKDLEELKKRVEEYGTNSVQHLYVDGSVKFEYMGRLILDPVAGKCYEAEGVGVHEAIKELLIVSQGLKASEEERASLKRHKEQLITGQYFISPEISGFTKGIKTRVVYLEGGPFGRRYTEYHLEWYKKDPFQLGEFLYDFSYKVGARAEDWFENPPKKEDLTPEQQTMAEQHAKEEIEAYGKELELLKRVAKIALRDKKYIFIISNGEVIEPVGSMIK